MNKNKKMKKKKENKFNGIILGLIILLLVIFSVFIIKESYINANKAKNISEKIINIYFNSKK